MTAPRCFLPLMGALLLAPLVLGAPDKDKADEEELLPPTTIKSGDFKKEIAALQEAAALLKNVSDEKSAKQACSKIQSLFRNLPPLLGGSHVELETLAKAQNAVSDEMQSRMKEPYFETAKMQEAWTLMTDAFSRPSATPVK